MVELLFLPVPWGCLLFVIVVFSDHTHLLFLILFTTLNFSGFFFNLQIFFLFYRITSFESSFTVVSVGQLQMTGPLLITFQQMADDPLQTDIDITMLVHWNPGNTEDHVFSYISF